MAKANCEKILFQYPFRFGWKLLKSSVLKVFNSFNSLGEKIKKPSQKPSAFCSFPPSPPPWVPCVPLMTHWSSQLLLYNNQKGSYSQIYKKVVDWTRQRFSNFRLVFLILIPYWLSNVEKWNVLKDKGRMYKWFSSKPIIMKLIIRNSF